MMFNYLIFFIPQISFKCILMMKNIFQLQLFQRETIQVPIIIRQYPYFSPKIFYERLQNIFQIQSTCFRFAF
ncbi:hypothetical protein TTHERM_000348189 (macronuclear) [Tetrahymena thermophila SB210]|uniref:Uncharacterized protein n=1 Tax=Tetrahymena thermophila (strain SB210) TaxID=312017 RepID=W7X061_TETTS|nr:hypothetical protein TTHERM_000348189 [Tetrahymena thermophila SB210]EWS72490.1 hypothetical protein TTHERM_000348189 [Tetrahymena thermophila SB210]|eukprot:XP_012654987.1 hypothetical protein TTHERM_000348189 [Tetrahymena thermophila SB210]